MVLGANAYRHIATYWPPASQSQYGGLEFDSPTTLMVRWEDRTEQFINAEGVETPSKSIVLVQVPVEVGGYLLRGNSNAADPTTLDNAQVIQSFTSVPDLRGLNEEMKAYL